MKLLSRALAERLLAVALGVVFVYASHDKIWQRPAQPAPGGASAAAPAPSGPAAFARVVYRYQLVGPDAALPPLVANFVAVTLPWVELLAGLLLIAGVWRREAALVLAVMLVVFVAAVGSALWRGIDLENCGCFRLDGAGRQAGLMLIAGDLGLLAAAAFLTTRPVAAPRAGGSGHTGDPAAR